MADPALGRSCCLSGKDQCSEPFDVVESAVGGQIAALLPLGGFAGHVVPAVPVGVEPELIGFAFAGAGTSSDPLISKDYINSTFKVEMIKSFAPISDFCKVVTSSAKAMGCVVFYTQFWKCSKDRIPGLWLNNKVFP